MMTFTKFKEVFVQISKNMAIELFKDQVTPAQLQLWTLKVEAGK